MTRIQLPESIASNKESLVITPNIAQPVSNIAGKWRGIVNCGGSNVIFNMAINSIDKYNIEAFFSQEETKGRTKLGKVKMLGKYDPDSSFFKFEKSSLKLEGVLDPETGRMTALARIGSSYYGNSCGYAIADKIEGRASSWKRPVNNIDTIIEYIEDNINFRERRRGRSKRHDCEGHIYRWMKPVLSFDYDTKASRLYPQFGAYYLFTDKMFKPYFGKSFYELNGNERNNLFSQLSESCPGYSTAGLKSHNAVSILKEVAGNIQGVHRGNNLIHPFAHSVLGNWRAHAASLIYRSTSHDSIIKGVPWQVFTLMWPSNGMSFESEFRERKSLSVINELRATINNQKDDFLSLHELSTFLDSYARRGISPAALSESKSMIKKRINKHLLQSAIKFFDSLSAVDDLKTHLKPIDEDSRYRHFAKYADTAVIIRINEIILARRNRLINDLISKEQLHIDNIMASDSSDLQKLQSMVTHDDMIRGKYKAISSNYSFKVFFKEYSNIRMKLIDANINELTQAFQSSRNKSDLENIYERYIAVYGKKKDLPVSVKIIDAVYLKTLKSFDPFSGLPGFEYLDAIYRNDYALMRQLDFIYQRIAIETINSKVKQYTGISIGRNAMGIAGSVVQGSSLIDSVLATYLFNYSANYGDCLESGGDTYTVSKVEVTTTRNGLGDYISTNYGPVSTMEYTVNKEFSQVFKKIYKLETNPLVFEAIDPLNGTRKIFNQSHLSCDSPQIKLFERNLIKLFNKHNGYEEVEVVRANVNQASNTTETLQNIPTGNGTLLYELSGHQDRVRSLAFSTNDTTLFSGSMGTRDNLNIWNVSQGSHKQGFWGGYDVEAIAYDPTGTYLATGGNTGRINLWTLADMQLLRQSDDRNPIRAPAVLIHKECQQFKCILYTLLFSSDGTYIASGSENGTIEIWNVKEKSRIKSIRAAHGERVLTISFTSNSRKILSSGVDFGDSRSVKMWDLNDESKSKTLLEATSGILSVAFSKNSQYFSVGYRSGLVEIRDTQKGGIIQTVSAFSGGVVTSSAFSPNGKYLVIGFWDGKVEVWDIENKIVLQGYEGHSKWTAAVTFSNDGKLFATGGADNLVKIWRLN